MSVEENKALVRRFYEETHSKGNLAAIDQFVAPDFENHNPFPGEAAGIEGVKQTLGMMLSTFADIQMTLEDQVSERDLVVSRGRFSATHTGEFMGIAPTGKRVTLPFIEIVRVAGGKISERWEIFDQAGMMQQLGAMAALG